LQWVKIMAETNLLGAKVKALRRREGMTQIELAKRLDVSPSYLNLIENNRRPLTASILLELAKIFHLDLGTFAAGDDDARNTADLLEVFGDPMFENHGITNADVRELCASSPNVARAILTLYRSYVDARTSTEALAERLSDGQEMTGVPTARLPSEEVADMIQHHMNYFPDIEEAAEELVRVARIDPDDAYRGLTRYLAEMQGIEVRTVRVADERKAMRRYDPERKLISLSEVLPPRSRRFQLAHQVGLLTCSPLFDTISKDPHLSTPESRALGRVALANYFAAAVLMPYAPFLEAAKAERYDVELLAHRFGTSFEQVCHRLTTLRRPGAEGIPFHLLRIDVAGNISKRFSGSGIKIARFSGACPRWNVHAAFLTPGMIRVQVSRMPDGVAYFCIARTIRSDRGGYNVPHAVQAIGMGCEVKHAKNMVYADGMDLHNEDAIIKVGVTCRLCDHLDCEQRAFPSIRNPLRIEENVRGVSFYAPVNPK
jgi:hypothetical protein